MDKFWMVWVEGTEGPRRRHEVRKLAEEEAERLVMQTNKKVYLLEMVAICAMRPQPVVWEIEYRAGPYVGE